MGAQMSEETTNELAVLPAVEPGMSTAQMLSVCSAIDEGLLTLTDEQHQMLTDQLRSKPDSLRYVVDELTDQAKRHRDYAREHMESARVAEAHAERLKNYLAWAMRRFGFEKLTGEQWQISLRKSERIDVVGEADETAAQHAPEFVRTKVSYEWNKAAIKDAVKSGTYPLANAQLTEHYSPQFKANKGIAK